MSRRTFAVLAFVWLGVRVWLEVRRRARDESLKAVLVAVRRDPVATRFCRSCGVAAPPHRSDCPVPAAVVQMRARAR